MGGIRRVTVVKDSCRGSGRFCTSLLNFSVVQRGCEPRHSSCGVSLRLSRVRLRLFVVGGYPGHPDCPRTCNLERLTFTMSSISSAMERLGGENVVARPVELSACANGEVAFFRSPSGLPLRVRRWEVAVQGL